MFPHGPPTSSPRYTGTKYRGLLAAATSQFQSPEATMGRGPLPRRVALVVGAVALLCGSVRGAPRATAAVAGGCGAGAKGAAGAACPVARRGAVGARGGAVAKKFQRSRRRRPPVGAGRGGSLLSTVPWKWSTEMRLKATSLVLLAVQNSLLSLTMRYSRTRKCHRPRFLASEAVVMSELFKTCVSLALATRAQEAPRHKFSQTLLDAYGKDGSYILVIPACMYVVQNNLQYVAASNLEPAIFQLLYQMKLLTTAFFSVLMLGRRLKAMQWGAIALLAAGLSGVGMTKGRDAENAPSANFPVGFTAVFAACCTSGFSSVFFERVVKVHRKLEKKHVSVWARNAQLATFSCLIATLTAFLKDGDTIRKRGLLSGFTPLVWCVVALQAGGGLCTAAVIAYADNLLKGFATGGSMLLSVSASCVWFDFEITRPFIAGAASVLAAILLYARA